LKHGQQREAPGKVRKGVLPAIIVQRGVRFIEWKERQKDPAKKHSPSKMTLERGGLCFEGEKIKHKRNNKGLFGSVQKGKTEGELQEEGRAGKKLGRGTKKKAPGSQKKMTSRNNT